MRISLVNPPFSLDEYFGGLSSTGSLEQPLGLGYLSSYLKATGHDVQLIDAAALHLGIEGIVSTVKGFSPDVIGYSVTTPGYTRAAALAQRVKEQLGVPTVIGGPHVTSLPAETLEGTAFDYAVVGEGELTSADLLDKIDSGGDLSSVRGIAYKEGGRVRLTQRREYIPDLDSLPFPDRASLPPLAAYSPSPSINRRAPLGTMITSRGCPYHCIFCDRAVFGNAYRSRSPRSVVDEMEELVDRHGAKEIRFQDDTFNLLPKRVLGICREIQERGLDVGWSCLGRVNNVTEEVLRFMRRAGCWQIDYGIETGNPRILAGVEKGITLEMVRKAVGITKEAGIGVRGFFMLGLPDETEETMKETIAFAKDLDLDVAVFHITTPLPGTALFEQAKRRGEISADVTWDKYLMFSADDLPYVTRGLTKELLKEYQSRAYKEFYLRPGYLLGRMGRMRSLGDLRRNAKAFFMVRGLDAPGA